MPVKETKTQFNFDKYSYLALFTLPLSCFLICLLWHKSFKLGCKQESYWKVIFMLGFVHSNNKRFYRSARTGLGGEMIPRVLRFCLLPVSTTEKDLSTVPLFLIPKSPSEANYKPHSSFTILILMCVCNICTYIYNYTVCIYIYTYMTIPC